MPASDRDRQEALMRAAAAVPPVRREALDRWLDAALEDSFPASDPLPPYRVPASAAPARRPTRDRA